MKTLCWFINDVMILRYSILLFCVFSCFFSAYADDGCAKNVNTSLEVIYSTRVLPNITGYQNFTGPYFYNRPGYSSACPYYIYNDASPDNSTRCCIDGVCNSTYRRITFTPLYTNCPLDDYIAWLLLPVGIFGFFFVKRQQLIGAIIQ